MNFSLSYLLVFLLLPCLSRSCMHTLSCDDSIEINPPFFCFDETNPSCRRKIKIECVGNIPTIYPFSPSSEYHTHGYYLENISYQNKTLVLQDPDMARFFMNSNCDSFMVTLSPFVAVKILHNSSSNGEEFINEVISISRTSHVNVVNLLGFCIEGSKQALVYEYMLNGSLDKYIYSENPETNLGCEKLYKITVGIARGLEYLQSGCNTHIIHFDIKPQNILLDEDFHPKIADFGLVKLCPPKESILSLADMRGTIGFIAPEVFSRSTGVVSTKSDIYSFGMLVLEMVGRRKNFKMSVQNSSQAYFPHWIYDHVAQNGEMQVCDVTYEKEQITRKMALVGLWCIQIAPTSRPSMSKVMEMFERSLDELEMPPKPFFNSPPRLQEIFSSYSNY